MATLIGPEPEGRGNAGSRGGGIGGGADPVAGGRLGDGDEACGFTMRKGSIRMGDVVFDVILVEGEPCGMGGDG